MLAQKIKNWIEKEYGQNLFDCEALAKHIEAYQASQIPCCDNCGHFIDEKRYDKSDDDWWIKYEENREEYCSGCYFGEPAQDVHNDWQSNFTPKDSTKDGNQ
jgi:hypothetical protein